MLRNRVKRIVWLCIVVLWITMVPVFAAKIIVQAPEQDLHYGCPFDVDVMIDTQWEENIWAAILAELPHGLTLEWFTFADTFTLSFPIKYEDGILRAYAFKFPGVFTGIVKFATLRLAQHENIDTNALSFKFNEVGDTTDRVDVYYMWWMDALTEIENADFIFSPGNCAGVVVLTGDQLQADFDQQGHLMWIYDIIDEYVTQSQDYTLMDWVNMYRYYVGVWLLVLIIIIVIFVLLHRRKK